MAKKYPRKPKTPLKKRTAAATAARWPKPLPIGSLPPLEQARRYAREGLGMADILKLVGDHPGIANEVELGRAELEVDVLTDLHNARRKGRLASLRLCYERFVEIRRELEPLEEFLAFGERLGDNLRRHGVEIPDDESAVDTFDPTLEARILELARLGVSTNTISILTGATSFTTLYLRAQAELRAQICKQILKDKRTGSWTAVRLACKAFLTAVEAPPVADHRKDFEDLIAVMHDGEHDHVLANLEELRKKKKK